MVVVDFDAGRVRARLTAAIDLFLGDPPDSEYQYGYLAALLSLWREAIDGGTADARVIAAERILARRAADNDNP